MTIDQGTKINTTWQFLVGAGLIYAKIEASDWEYDHFYYFGFPYGIEGNRIYLNSPIQGNTYRDVEFLSDNEIRMTKEDEGIIEVWTRVEE